jgi:catechol 2,3-dioxygenase-like lactoylglutathione lyase family enzyme
MARLGYATVGSNRLEEAKAFYDAWLVVAGIAPAFDHPSGGRVYALDGSIVFGVVGPFNGKAASAGNGTMISLLCDTPEEVDALHAKALALGATDEGAPGFRGGSPFYMSYFRDLDGNKLCVYFVGT